MNWLVLQGKKLFPGMTEIEDLPGVKKAVKGLKVIGCTTKGGHYSVSTLRAATVGEREAKFCSVKVVSHVKEW